MAGSPPNFHKMDYRSACIQGVLKVKVKGHVIWALLCWHENRFFSQANGPIATKLAHDGLQVNLHPGCAQGQGQRLRDTCTFLDSWNELLRHGRSGFALKTERVVQYHHTTPPPSPMCRMKWCNGHGSCGSWVTKDDPFPSLEWSLRLGTVNGVYQCKHVLVTDMLLCQYRQWRHCSSMIVHFSLTVLATSTPPCCSPTGRNFAHCSKMSASHLRFVIAMLQPCRIGR